MILIAFDGVCDTIAGGKKTALQWGSDLKSDGTFRLYSQHNDAEAEKGAGIQRTLREVPDEDGTLRLDLQRVFGKGGTTADVTTYRARIGKQYQVIAPEEAEKLKSKKKKVLELKETVTTFANIWSLYGVQEGKPGTKGGKQYNRIFVLNNQNLVNAITLKLWNSVFAYTLDNACTMIVTINNNTLPDGYSSDKCTEASKLGIT